MLHKLNRRYEQNNYGKLNDEVKLSLRGTGKFEETKSLFFQLGTCVANNYLFNFFKEGSGKKIVFIHDNIYKIEIAM